MEKDELVQLDFLLEKFGIVIPDSPIRVTITVCTFEGFTIGFTKYKILGDWRTQAWFYIKPSPRKKINFDVDFERGEATFILKTVGLSPNLIIKLGAIRFR